MRPVALAAAAVILVGCAKAPESEGAKRAVAARAPEARTVDCTDRSVRWFREGPPARRFVCIARMEHGHCDRYLVERKGGAYRTERVDRDTVDCALPVG